MILLDASIIIDDLRAKDPDLIERMRSLGGTVCGVTRAEVLTGARGPENRAKLQTILNSVQQVGVPDSLWDAAGDMQAGLRAAGVTVPLADAVLATLGVILGVEVWTQDSHFRAMQSVVPALRLFDEAT